MFQAAVAWEMFDDTTLEVSLSCKWSIHFQFGPGSGSLPTKESVKTFPATVRRDQSCQDWWILILTEEMQLQHHRWTRECPCTISEPAVLPCDGWVAAVLVELPVAGWTGTNSSVVSK